MDKQVVIIEDSIYSETEKAYSFLLSNRFFALPKSQCEISGRYFKKGEDNSVPLKHSVYVFSINKAFFDTKLTDVFKKNNRVKVVN